MRYTNAGSRKEEFEFIFFAVLLSYLPLFHSFEQDDGTYPEPLYRIKHALLYEIARQAKVSGVSNVEESWDEVSKRMTHALLSLSLQLSDRLGTPLGRQDPFKAFAYVVNFRSSVEDCHRYQGELEAYAHQANIMQKCERDKRYSRLVEEIPHESDLIHVVEVPRSKGPMGSWMWKTFLPPSFRFTMYWARKEFRKEIDPNPESVFQSGKLDLNVDGTRDVMLAVFMDRSELGDLGVQLCAWTRDVKMNSAREIVPWPRGESFSDYAVAGRNQIAASACDHQFQLLSLRRSSYPTHFHAMDPLTKRGDGLVVWLEAEGR